jgi:hypothetical protein
MSSTKKRTKQAAAPKKTGRLDQNTADSRALAKAGMTISLGALVWTGFVRTRGSRRLHRLAGLSLVGFSLWHHALYPKKTRNKS